MRPAQRVVPAGGLPAPRRCLACDVREQAICGGLACCELSALQAVASFGRVDRGQSLFTEGDAAAYLLTLTEGTVRLSKMLADGRQQITGFAMPGDFLGLAFRDRYPYSADAVTPVAFCRFARGRFEDLVERHPAMERRLLEFAGRELALAQEQMLLLGRKTARERLASFLLAMAERQAQDDGQPLVTLPMGRADIGDYLGLTIETVSRTLSAFAGEKLIALPDTRHVALRDVAALRALAEG